MTTADSPWRPDMILVVLAVLFAPVNYLRVDVAYFTLSDAFSAMALICMFLGNRLPLRPFGQATQVWYGCLLMMIGGLLLGSAMNGSLVSGIVVSGQYLFSLMIVPMLILQRSRSETVLLIRVFVLGMVAVMVHGAWMVQFYPDDVRFVTRSGRLASLVERENAAAALAALAITFSLWLFLTRRMGALMLAATLAVLGYGLLLTGSNTGFLLTAIGVVALVLLSGSGRIIVTALVVFAALIAVLLTWGEAFLPDIFLKRVFGAWTSGDIGQAGTFSDRMFLIREAFDLSRNTILVGLGADQYRIVSTEGVPVHNTYLLLLVEGGLISLLGHIGLFITSLVIGWTRLMHRTDRWSGVLTLTVVVMLALVLTGLAHFYGRFWAMPWFLALAVSLYPVPVPEDAPVAGAPLPSPA